MDPSNFSQIDAACEHVEKMQDPANATVTNVPPALDPAVITSNAGHLSAPQPAYDPDLQQAFDELMEYIEAQDALNSVQNTSVPTCTPTLCPNGVEVQEASRESKESPLKRKALPSKVGPPSKKGVAKRPLSEAAQKHAAEERSAQPLRDITASVQNNRSATKGVSRRVRHEKVSAHYTPNMMNNPLHQSILHRGGVSTGGVLTNTDNTGQGLCKTATVGLGPLIVSKGKGVSITAALKKKHKDSENLPNPLKRVKSSKVFTEPQAEPLNLKKTAPMLPEVQAKPLSPEKKKPRTPEPHDSPLDLSVKKTVKPLNEAYTPVSPKEAVVVAVDVEEMAPPQPPKTSRLSRKHLKLKPGVPKLQIAASLSNHNATLDPSSILKPQTVPNKITVHVEVHAPEQPPKPVVSVQAQPRVSKGNNTQPLEGPSIVNTPALELIRWVVDSLGRTPEAVSQGSLSTAGLQNPANRSAHPDTGISARTPDYNDSSSQSSYPLSPSTPPGAYDPTSPAASPAPSPASSPAASPVYSPVSSPASSPPASPVYRPVSSPAASHVYSPGSSPAAVVSPTQPSAISVDDKTTGAQGVQPLFPYKVCNVPFLSAPGRSPGGPISRTLSEQALQNGAKAVSSIDGPKTLQPFIRPRKVGPSKQAQEGSVNTYEVFAGHVKEMQMAVRKLKRQALAANLKWGVGVNKPLYTSMAHQKIVERVGVCKKVIIQECQAAVADIHAIRA
ncbi:uncharacterized protein LOC144799224 [Lissotriton helveticus]